VVRLGGEPQVYAEEILNVCKHYLESPLVCVSGITGRDLKQRIGRILSQHRVLDLNLSKKVLLTVVGVLTVAMPVIIGIANAAAPHAQTAEGHPKFEVASVKPTNSAHRRPLFITSRVNSSRCTSPYTRWSRLLRGSSTTKP
jgi:hypothetical protein